MKKKVLFAIESLAGGGAEKILATIVKNIDKTKFDITVLTVVKTGVYVEEVEKYCTLISMLPEYEKLTNPIDKIKYKVDYREVEPTDDMIAIDKKIRNKEYVTLWSFQFYSDLLILGLGFDEKASLCFYSLKTGQFMNGIRIMDDMYLKNNSLKLRYTNLPHIVIDGYLYAPISPTTLINGYTNYKQSASSQEWNTFKQEHAFLVDLCESISEEDNPVLLRIKLKKVAQ